jgi:hypothetical protein
MSSHNQQKNDERREGCGALKNVQRTISEINSNHARYIKKSIAGQKRKQRVINNG